MIDTTGIQLVDSIATVMVEDGKVMCHREQDIQPLLDQNAKIYGDSLNGNIGNHLLAFSIPTAMIDKWLSEGVPFWDKDFDVKHIEALLRTEPDGHRFLTTKHNL